MHANFRTELWKNIASWADRNFPTKREDTTASLNRLRSLLLGRELFQFVRQLPHLIVGECAGCLLIGLELFLDLTDPLLRFLIAELLLQGHYITGSINVAVCLLLLLENLFHVRGVSPSDPEVRNPRCGILGHQPDLVANLINESLVVGDDHHTALESLDGSHQSDQ